MTNDPKATAAIEELRRRTAEAGFDHHFVKPVEPKAIEGLLAELKRPNE